jgi:hypothetical protein
VKTLIAKLADVSKEGLGYAGAYAGTSFLPYPGSDQPGAMLLMQPAPVESPTLRALVELGVAAVPELADCLSDGRPTRVPPVRALMWMEYADEMDVNVRTEPPPPPLLERHGLDAAVRPEPYQVTVGDLCFVALGQVLNRSWSAVRYQPTGGVVVSSPSRSPALREAVRKVVLALTPERHREQLLRDFREPDGEGRREGAALRLAFYYPEALEQRAIELLGRPTFDVFEVERFARQTLYAEPSARRRRELFDGFVRERGPAARAGLLLQLYDDLAYLEADEEHRVSPPLTAFRTQPREILVDVYGLPSGVRSVPRPWVDYVATTELTRLVEHLVYDRSPRIDDAVRALMAATPDEDLRRACARRFAGR